MSPEQAAKRVRFAIQPLIQNLPDMLQITAQKRIKGIQEAHVLVLIRSVQTQRTTQEGAHETRVETCQHEVRFTLEEVDTLPPLYMKKRVQRAIEKPTYRNDNLSITVTAKTTYLPSFTAEWKGATFTTRIGSTKLEITKP